MKKSLSILPVLILSALPTLASADDGGLFIEPMVTYERGDGEVDLPAPFGDADTETSGFGVGARLGFHVQESLFIGADGRYSSLSFEDDALDTDTDAKKWNLAPVLGIQMPTLLGLRLWGAYVLTGELDPDKDQNVNLRFSNAKGYRLGGGVKLGYVSLNLEYENLTYDKTHVDEVGAFTPGYSRSDIELDAQNWILSVSFPFSL